MHHLDVKGHEVEGMKMLKVKGEEEDACLPPSNWNT
jgi:hypothetical protein